MTSQSVEENIMRIIGGHLGIPIAALRRDLDISRDLGADSLDRLELIMTIEERFGVKIPERDIADLHNIADIVTYIEGILTGDFCISPKKAYFSFFARLDHI